MEIWQAVVLGVVQGIGEFLPVSSSGHLAVMQHVFDIDEQGLIFDIVLHIGTLCAVFAVFWPDIVTLIKNPFQKMTGMLIVGTIPAVAAGLFLRSHMDYLNQGFYLAIAFIFTGVLLLISDNINAASAKRNEDEITVADAVIVGLMQAAAIPPGVSRSGATITGGLISGLNRKTAARFSFLLSIIAIIGAGTLEGYHVFVAGEGIYAGDIPAFMIGFVTAAVSGYYSIRLLLKLLDKAKLKYFAYYVFILASLILLDNFLLNWFFSRF